MPMPSEKSFQTLFYSFLVIMFIHCNQWRQIILQNDNACPLLNRYLRNNNISRISQKTFEWNRNLWYLYVQMTINVFWKFQADTSYFRTDSLEHVLSILLITCVSYALKRRKKTYFFRLRIWPSSIPCLCESSRMN